jgi:hypothetical protein
MRILLCGNLGTHTAILIEIFIFLGYDAISNGKCQYYLPPDAALYSRRAESS